MPRPEKKEEKDSRNRVSVWAGLCGNGEMIGPFLFNGSEWGKLSSGVAQTDISPTRLRFWPVVRQ